MNKSLIKRTVAGISALAMTAGTYVPSVQISAEDVPVLYGDVNCDGEVNLQDVSKLTAYLKDAAANPLTDQEKKNANAFRPVNTGLSYEDAIVIIEFLAGSNELSTVDLKSPAQKKVDGDADCDGDFDFDDVTALNKFLADKAADPLTPEGENNANVYRPVNTGLGTDDVQVMIEILAGKNEANTTDLKSSSQEKVDGDADCDGDFDFDDVTAL
ncbi:MAG: hypothetical protein ILP22_12160, partial [Oscillospiraceae bacterium]|nr:hypothetical protein [Oscillospiraceae bacterium]